MPFCEGLLAEIETEADGAEGSSTRISEAGDKIGDDAFAHGMRLVMLDAVLAWLRRSPFPLQAHGMINLCDRLDRLLRQFYFFG